MEKLGLVSRRHLVPLHILFTLPKWRYYRKNIGYGWRGLVLTL